MSSDRMLREKIRRKKESRLELPIRSAIEPATDVIVAPIKREEQKVSAERASALNSTPSLALDSKGNVVKQEKIMEQSVNRLIQDTKKKHYTEAVDQDKLAIQTGMKLGSSLQGLERQKTSKDNFKASKRGYKEMKKMKKRTGKQSKYEGKASDIVEDMEGKL